MAMVELVSAWLHGLKQYDQGTYWHSVRTAEAFVRFMDYFRIRGERAKYIILLPGIRIYFLGLTFQMITHLLVLFAADCHSREARLEELYLMVVAPQM
jgi:hypothetical protein